MRFLSQLPAACLIGLSLSMDAFAVAIGNGIHQTGATLRHALITAAFFGLFQGGMPLLGWCLGSAFVDLIDPFDHWIAFGLLVLIGVNMILDACREPDPAEAPAAPFRFRTLLMTSTATSVDALAVGVSFSMMGIHSLLAVAWRAGIILTVTFVMGLAGFYLGRWFGVLRQRPAGIAGGLVLIGIGGKILLEALLR